MFLVGGYNNCVPGLYLIPFAIAVDLVFPGMDKHLMFPVVRMLRGVSSGGDLKQSHTKITRTLFLAYHHAPVQRLSLLRFQKELV